MTTRTVENEEKKSGKLWLNFNNFMAVEVQNLFALVTQWGD